MSRDVDLTHEGLPHLLSISRICYFSRFDIQGSVKRKLRTDIRYPLTNLDITPYICPVFRKHPKYNLCAVVVSLPVKLAILKG